MTFLPQVLTKDDPNNSTVVGTTGMTGAATQTTGYNSIIITITGVTGPCSNEVQYSNEISSNFSTFYMDSVLTGSTFIKSYPILKNYYRIKFTGTATSIQSRLSTQSYQSNTTNTINTFQNNIENTMDAFGKLRVSAPNTLLDIRVPGQDASGLGNTGTTGYSQNDIQICYNVSGSGGVGATAYKVCNNSQNDIYVTGNYTFINQSRKYCTYQPGKSLLIMATGMMDAIGSLPNGITGANNTPGMKSKIGYFDDYNGLYFEYDSDSTKKCAICIKSHGELKYESPIYQSLWNIDKMNGTGPSGLTLDFTKAQLFVIDLEWLGVGRIRFGFYAYGRIQYCHEILNINQISVGPYTYNINLPIRYELQGQTGHTGAMIQVCSTVISEGGYTPVGKPFTYQNITGVALSQVSTAEYPLLLIKGGGSNYYHQQIQPTQISIASSGTNDILVYYLRMYLPPNTPGSSITWNQISDYSVVEGATSVTNYNVNNSILVDSNVIIGRGGVTYSGLSNIFTDLLQITSDINNNSSILVLSFARINGSGSSTIYGTISWQEIY